MWFHKYFLTWLEEVEEVEVGEEEVSEEEEVMEAVAMELVIIVMVLAIMVMELEAIIILDTESDTEGVFAGEGITSFLTKGIIFLALVTDIMALVAITDFTVIIVAFMESVSVGDPVEDHMQQHTIP